MSCNTAGGQFSPHPWPQPAQPQPTALGLAVLYLLFLHLSFGGLSLRAAWLAFCLCYGILKLLANAHSLHLVKRLEPFAKSEWFLSNLGFCLPETLSPKE